MNITALKQAHTVLTTTLLSQHGVSTRHKQMVLPLLVRLNRCASIQELISWRETVQQKAAGGFISPKIAGLLLRTTQPMRFLGFSRTSGSSLRPSSSAAAGCSAQCTGNTSPRTFRACIRHWTRRLLSTAVRTK